MNFIFVTIKKIRYFDDVKGTIFWRVFLSFISSPLGDFNIPTDNRLYIIDKLYRI